MQAETQEESATSHFEHPVLDFRCLSGDAPAHIRHDALQRLDEAFRTHGFIYLTHYGIPQSLVGETFDWIKRFFALPHDTKSLVRRSTDPYKPRGYTMVGDAELDQEEQPHSLEELADARAKAPVEQRETLELGNPRSLVQDPNLILPEAIFPGFAGWLEEWWDACMSLQLSLMGCFDEILTGESIAADGLVSQQDIEKSRSNMSLIHYHGVAKSDIDAKVASRCNAHTDSGQLTLLFQDNVGGLEVCDRRDADGRTKFVPVPPVPGAMIVQLGDMLEKQSNGRWRSALHRVTAPQSVSPSTEEQVLHDRYSVAFFVYPQFETRIEPLPGCEVRGPWNSMDWGSVQTAGEWWRKRIALEFAGYASRAKKEQENEKELARL